MRGRKDGRRPDLLGTHPWCGTARFLPSALACYGSRVYRSNKEIRYENRLCFKSPLRIVRCCGVAVLLRARTNAGHAGDHARSRDFRGYPHGVRV